MEDTLTVKLVFTMISLAPSLYTLPLPQCVDTHLKFIAFLLKEGALYMPAKRACEIWDTLIANPHACDADRRVRMGKR